MTADPTLPLGPTMTPAELHTARDSLGISGRFLAERAGCHEQMIWRYEHPDRTDPVPERITDTVRDLLNDFEIAANRLIDLSADEGVIPRWSDIEDFYNAVPWMRGWGERAQGLLVAEVQRRLVTAVEYR